MDKDHLANLYLGSLTARNAIYVDNIKHLDGSNWSFSGGGGNSSMRAGQHTTDGNGERTITFPQGTFTASPIVTITVVDTSNNNQGDSQAYTAKIVEVTKDHFKVRILTSRHKHQIASTGVNNNMTLFHQTKIAGTTAPNEKSDSHYVTLHYVPLIMRLPDESTSIVGELPTGGGPIAASNWYTGTEDGANPVGSGIVFNWIAVPSNQGV